ncbi:hypothetical protein F5B21DRAFT_527630 [Xylaria acuta]|nr:hypothetical protein F5B21DRAFT_527630 [Xylaria acuta]
MDNLDWFEKLSLPSMALCVNRISDFDSLKQASRYTLVAIDFTGQHTLKSMTTGITEVGLAVMTSPITGYGMNPTALEQNKTLEGFVRENDVESRYMKIRQPGPIETSPDPYRLGIINFITPEEVATSLATLLQTIWERRTRPIILVGFDIAFDLTAILSFYSDITPYFSSWVDLQQIMTTFTAQQSPGLRETLLAFGFAQDDLSICGRRDQHTAGNDAVRKLAVLTNLLHLKNGSRLNISVQPKDGHPLWKYWSGFRPAPSETNRFAAYIRVRGKAVNSVISDLTELFGLFPDWKPTTVGWTRDRQYACICLPSEEDLKRFITEFHGKEFKGETWDVFAEYSPQMSPLIPPHIKVARPKRNRKPTASVKIS